MTAVIAMTNEGNKDDNDDDDNAVDNDCRR